MLNCKTELTVLLHLIEALCVTFHCNVTVFDYIINEISIVWNTQMSRTKTQELTKFKNKECLGYKDKFLLHWNLTTQNSIPKIDEIKCNHLQNLHLEFSFVDTVGPKISSAGKNQICQKWYDTSLLITIALQWSIRRESIINMEQWLNDAKVLI